MQVIGVEYLAWEVDARDRPTGLLSGGHDFGATPSEQPWIHRRVEDLLCLRPEQRIRAGEGGS